MFVVRLKRPSEDFDLKAFASKRAALVRFRAAQSELINGDVEQCSLFEVRSGDAEHAVELVGQGHGTLIQSDLEDARLPIPVRRSRARADECARIKRRRARSTR